MFAGTAAVDRAVLAGVPTWRLSVAPVRGEKPPHSFALDPRAEPVRWRTARGTRLPAGVRWRQERESRWIVEFPLPHQVRCWGLGELYRGLNRRGRAHLLFNTDDPNHTESTPCLYKSVPFLILARGSEALGLFLDSPAPQRWNLGSDLGTLGRVELLSRRGFCLYVFGPTTLPDVVAAFTTLTGRTPLPPRWSLGHQQSRWSYPTEHRVREIATEFRRRRIPCDAVVIDIDYMDDYRVFTVSRERFPTFEAMSAELRTAGFQVVTILDPAVKKSGTDETYRSGRRRNVFCTTAAGQPYVGQVWAGASCLPDFVRDDVRHWWGERLEFFDRVGVAGIWNDMNEPALFDCGRPLPSDARELPPDTEQVCLQQPPEGPVGHFEVRNLYGSQMARAAYENLRQRRPDERPFVLSRAGYAGMQRFGAVWLGDNYSWFEHLRMSLPMLVSMGMSGVPFVGVDIGGFGADADGELLVRWYQVGIFYPFFRNHCALGRRPHEPWAFGPVVEGYVRRLIQARYRLLPYFEQLFAEHRRTGAPLLRPLAWHAPEDVTAAEVEDQMFLGRDLLVAPIVHRGKSRRLVYLPRGRWTPFDGGPSLSGGRTYDIEIGFDAVPAFVREGTILPLLAPVQHTGECQAASVTFRCVGSRARATYREDDGASLEYEHGVYNEWELRWARGELSARVTHLGMKPTGRRYLVESGGRRRSFRLPTSP